MNGVLRSLEWVGRDVAVLASKVTDLAGLGLSRVTGRNLSANVGVLVG